MLRTDEEQWEERLRRQDIQQVTHLYSLQRDDGRMVVRGRQGGRDVMLLSMSSDVLLQSARLHVTHKFCDRCVPLQPALCRAALE